MNNRNFNGRHVLITNKNLRAFRSQLKKRIIKYGGNFMIESSVIRKISDLNNDNRDWQSLEEIENKIIKAATKGYQLISVGRLGDYAVNILKDSGFSLCERYITTENGYDFLGTLIRW
jgi:hypothetical protein